MLCWLEGQGNILYSVGVRGEFRWILKKILKSVNRNLVLARRRRRGLQNQRNEDNVFQRKSLQ